mmetsp:Transcript_33930/g.47298  ORF Transcript_33930/g.47298 Transcript_33930/m.47298 type:complete len:93 (+) Transcript_33930:525-803(+)
MVESAFCDKEEGEKQRGEDICGKLPTTTASTRSFNSQKRSYLDSPPPVVVSQDAISKEEEKEEENEQLYLSSRKSTEELEEGHNVDTWQQDI